MQDPDRPHLVAARDVAARWCALALCVALSACGANVASVDDVDRASRTVVPARAAGVPRPDQDAPRAVAGAALAPSVAPAVLPGAGAVAFDASGTRLAWTSGTDVRVRSLPGGSDMRLDAGPAVDVGFAPDGALWVVGRAVERWIDGARACSADIEADRLLATDAAGAVVAGYMHSDGSGMLRRQSWVDASCRVTDARTDPLPGAITDSAEDAGAPLRRATLRDPHGQAPTLPPGAPTGARPVAGSIDGVHFVIETGGERRLWSAPAR